MNRGRFSLRLVRPLVAMKLKALLLSTLAALALLLPRPAEARVSVSFDFFFDALSPYGEWIEVGDYGTCWRPSITDPDWRPYSDGYWSYTDGGWTWVSYEDFGGIVYHYGRWVDVEGEGWCWVPDEEWAPAWVSWRTSDDYIGWAPLPPEARWRRNTGFSVWVDSYYDIGPARFNFCRVRDFGAPYLRPVIVNRFENVTIIQGTTNVTNITYFDSGDFGGLVHCGGPSFGFVNQHVLRPIPALKLVQKTQINNITNINVQNLNVFNAEPRGNSLAVLVPQVSPPAADIRRPQPVRSIPAARIRKGWDNVKDPEVATVIRTRMQRESRGLTPDTAPARKVQAAELKVVPEKVDTSAPSPLRTARERGNDTRRREGAPATVVQQPPAPKAPQPAEAKPSQPVDARTAERMAREAARQPGQVAVPPVPGTVAPVPPEKPVAEQKKGKEEKNPAASPAIRETRSREMTRSIPSAVPTPSAPTAERSRSVSRGADEAAAARARAEAMAAEQERAATEQRLRSAAMERQRAAEDSMRRQKEAAAQAEVERERQRREMPAPTVRRSEPTEPPRRESDDSGRRAAEAAVQRQRQIESARSQQMENARREAAAESARRAQAESMRREQASQAARQQQMEAARREQAVQSARQAQMENARRESAQENARRAQMESARREQAAAASRQAEASRQMEAARQAQQRSESMRREPVPQRYGPPPTQSRSESRDRSEEAEAARKGRSR